jgi:catecholate siderophore receptor
MRRGEIDPPPSACGTAAGVGPLVAGTLGFSLPWLLGPLAQACGAGAVPTPEESGNPLSEVTVSGVRSLLHDKLAESEQNAPQSITVVSNQVMQAQGTTSLEDALRNVPGITLNAGEGAARGDTVNLRGFSAFNDFFLDGIRDAAIYTRDDFDVQTLEVLEGPSAVLFGRGSTGGAINEVSKAPQLRPLAVISTQLGTNEMYRATADLDGPLSPTAAVRLNLMAQSAGVAERDLVRNRRWGVAPAVAFGIGGRDSLIFAYLHQQQDDILDTGIPFLGGRPAPVRRDAFFGLAGDRGTTDDDILTARYRHEPSDSLSLADTLRYARYAFDYEFASPNFGAEVLAPDTPPAALVVGRDSPDSAGVQTNLDDQLDLTARFRIGPVAHTLVAGVELARQTADIDRERNPFDSDNGWIPETPLLDPDPYERRPAEPVSAEQHTVAPSAGAYVIDTLGFGPRLDLSVGYRYDQFSATYRNLTVETGALLRLHELNRVGSPRASLIFKPMPGQTYYVSLGTSFDPSAEALALTTRTAALGPVKATSYEAGAKTTWLQGGLLLSGAVFRTEVDNAQTNDPDNPTLTVLNGNERVDGFELQASGHLTERWEVLAGYAYLDGRTLASGTAAEVGKAMPNTARHSLDLWSEYDLPGGWEIGGGGNWLSRRFADGAETAYVPGYVLWNAMVSYHAAPRLRLQLNAFNLFDRLYYDGIYYTGASENHVIPGAGRSVMLTLRWRL